MSRLSFCDSAALCSACSSCFCFAASLFCFVCNAVFVSLNCSSSDLPRAVLISFGRDSLKDLSTSPATLCVKAIPFVFRSHRNLDYSSATTPTCFGGHFVTSLKFAFVSHLELPFNLTPCRAFCWLTTERGFCDKRPALFGEPCSCGQRYLFATRWGGSSTWFKGLRSVGVTGWYSFECAIFSVLLLAGVIPGVIIIIIIPCVWGDEGGFSHLSGPLGHIHLLPLFLAMYILRFENHNKVGMVSRPLIQGIQKHNHKS